MFLQSEKLVGSNEIISLFCKQVCDHQGSIHRTLVTVMHQEDGTVMNLGTDNGQDAVCAAAFPVQGIDIPEYRQHGEGQFHIFLPGTEGRADIGWINASDFVDAVVGFLDFLKGFFPGNLIQLHVIPGMVSNQMSVFLHFQKDLFVSFDVFPYQKEGSKDVSLSQSFQQHRGILGVRSIIKGKGYPGRFFHGLLHQGKHSTACHCAGCPGSQVTVHN